VHAGTLNVWNSHENLSYFYISSTQLSVFVKINQEVCGMKKLTIIMLVTLSILSGCSTADKQAAELLDTARFEEKQNNYAHAAQLYDEILKKYPASPASKEAATRAAELSRQNRP
jgi:hypothetical protein